MSGILFGQEISGTPIETRGGTEQIAGDLLSGGGRLQQGTATGTLGFDPTSDIGAAVMRLLADPADRLQGLFAALEPFEERQREEAVAGTRGAFGRLGGRFSRNLLEGEARTRGEVAGQQTRVRQESILEAGGQQQELIATLLSALLQGRGQTLGFFQPGQPQFQQGLLGDLIAAGGIAAASQIGN